MRILTDIELTSKVLSYFPPKFLFGNFDPEKLESRRAHLSRSFYRFFAKI
jgi:hypothetical protein